MIERVLSWFNEALTGTSLSESLVIFIENTSIILVTIVLAWLADFLVKRILITTITRIAKQTKNDWDDIFIERHVFNRLAHLAPALVVYYALQYIFDLPKLVEFLENLTQTYMVLVIVMVIDAVINAFHEIYHRLPISKGRNIKGFIQVLKIIFYFVAIIFIISIFSGSPPQGPDGQPWRTGCCIYVCFQRHHSWFCSKYSTVGQ